MSLQLSRRFKLFSRRFKLSFSFISPPLLLAFTHYSNGETNAVGAVAIILYYPVFFLAFTGAREILSSRDKSQQRFADIIKTVALSGFLFGIGMSSLQFVTDGTSRTVVDLLLPILYYGLPLGIAMGAWDFFEYRKSLTDGQR